MLLWFSLKLVKSFSTLIMFINAYTKIITKPEYATIELANNEIMQTFKYVFSFTLNHLISIPN